MRVRVALSPPRGRGTAATAPRCKRRIPHGGPSPPVLTKNGPVVQLEEATASKAVECWFESDQAHHPPILALRRKSAALFGNQRRDLRQESVEILARIVATPHHDSLNAFRVADVGQRIGVQQNQVRRLPDFNGATLFGLPEISSRIARGALQSFKRRQSG